MPKKNSDTIKLGKDYIQKNSSLYKAYQNRAQTKSLFTSNVDLEDYSLEEDYQDFVSAHEQYGWDNQNVDEKLFLKVVYYLCKKSDFSLENYKKEILTPTLKEPKYYLASEQMGLVNRLKDKFSTMERMGIFNNDLVYNRTFKNIILPKYSTKLEEAMTLEEKALKEDEEKERKLQEQFLKEKDELLTNLKKTEDNVSKSIKTPDANEIFSVKMNSIQNMEYSVNALNIPVVDFRKLDSEALADAESIYDRIFGEAQKSDPDLMDHLRISYDSAKVEVNDLFDAEKNYINNNLKNNSSPFNPSNNKKENQFRKAIIIRALANPDCRVEYFSDHSRFNQDDFSLEITKPVAPENRALMEKQVKEQKEFANAFEKIGSAEKLGLFKLNMNSKENYNKPLDLEKLSPNDLTEAEKLFEQYFKPVIDYEKTVSIKGSSRFIDNFEMNTKIDLDTEKSISVSKTVDQAIKKSNSKLDPKKKDLYTKALIVHAICNPSQRLFYNNVIINPEDKKPLTVTDKKLSRINVIKAHSPLEYVPQIESNEKSDRNIIKNLLINKKKVDKSYSVDIFTSEPDNNLLKEDLDAFSDAEKTFKNLFQFTGNEESEYNSKVQKWIDDHKDTEFNISYDISTFKNGERTSFVRNNDFSLDENANIVFSNTALDTVKQRDVLIPLRKMSEEGTELIFKVNLNHGGNDTTDFSIVNVYKKDGSIKKYLYDNTHRYDIHKATFNPSVFVDYNGVSLSNEDSLSNDNPEDIVVISGKAKPKKKMFEFPVEEKTDLAAESDNNINENIIINNENNTNINENNNPDNNNPIGEEINPDNNNIIDENNNNPTNNDPEKNPVDVPLADAVGENIHTEEIKPTADAVNDNIKNNEMPKADLVNNDDNQEEKKDEEKPAVDVIHEEKPAVEENHPTADNVNEPKIENQADNIANIELNDVKTQVLLNNAGIINEADAPKDEAEGPKIDAKVDAEVPKVESEGPKVNVEVQGGAEVPKVDAEGIIVDNVNPNPVPPVIQEIKIEANPANNDNPIVENENHDAGLVNQGGAVGGEHEQPNNNERPVQAGEEQPVPVIDNQERPTENNTQPNINNENGEQNRDNNPENEILEINTNSNQGGMGVNEPQQVAANNENRNSPFYLDTSTVDEALIDRNKKPALFDYLKEHYENDSHYNYLIKKYEKDLDYNYANVPFEELRDAQTFYHHAGDYEKDVYSKLFQKLFNNDGEKFRQFVLNRLNPDVKHIPHMDAVYYEISNMKTASIPVILEKLRSNNNKVKIADGKVTQEPVGTYDALFADITYGNCSEYGIDPKRLYLVDQELTKDPVHSTEEHKLPAQYEGKGKLWIPYAFRPYEEYTVHHLNDKVTDLINKLPTKYPNDPQKQEDVKSALNKANNYIYNKDDKATSFYSTGTHYECLTGERATKSVRDMAEISLHSVSNIDNYEHIYAYKNDALQAKIANGEINSEQSQKAFEKVKLLNFDTSEEYKEKLIQFINKIKQYNNDFFSNKQNFKMKAGANGFSIKLRAAYREMEQAVQEGDYDHIQEKVTAYEQIRGEMQQLYKEGLELFKNGTPHVVSTNADMLRDNDLPLEYATLGDNALISKLNAVFNMAITCELLSVPVEDFVKDPVNTIFKGYENVNKSTGAASDLLADELIQENEGYWNRKKSAISRLAGAARRSLDCIATGDNAEKTGENILKWHIVAGLNDDLYQTQHDLVDGFRDVLKRPEGNPEAYTQILGANLLGTDKIRLNIPKQRNESGLTPVGRTELPDISEYKENINTERFNKLLNDVNMLIRNNPNSTPRNAVGYVSAAYKILKNRDMKKEQNLKLLTKVKDMESRLKMTDNFSKRLLKAGKAEFEIGQEVLKNEDIKAAEQISKESITDLPASLDKVGSVFGKRFNSSEQFREANNAISDLAEYAGRMKLVKKPDDEMLKTYKEKMLKAIDKCTAYLDKKNKEMYDSRHSRSDYEKKRVLAVSRICERLKKEYALNKTKTIMLNRTEFALEALKNPEIDKPEYKDVKYKMAAWATVGREFRRKDYKMSRPNDSVNTMLNSAGFKRIVDTHTGAELFNIIKNYEMTTLLMNQINNPSASGNQKTEGKEIKNTQPGNTNELKQAKGKEIAPKV